jgi:N-acetylmuramoyl-L-alanine amidase
VESNGGAEIDIVGNAPLLARFSPDRKSITVVPVAQVAGQRPATLPGATPPATAQAPPSPVPALPANVAAAPPPAVVIDPAHGGQDRGAMVGNLAEKDITLGFAKALRQQLEARGIHAALVREGDATIPLDDRAALANRSRAQLYVAVHAASGGSAVALYTSLLPPAEPNRGQFLAWNSAQAPYLGASLNVASTITSELRTQRLGSRSHPAPLRPLNSAALPAIAIELGTADGDPKSLASPRYQEAIASALASAIATARSKMGNQP